MLEDLIRKIKSKTDEEWRSLTVDVLLAVGVALAATFTLWVALSIFIALYTTSPLLIGIFFGILVAICYKLVK